MTLEAFNTSALDIPESNGLASLLEWGRAADAVYRVAEKIVGTPFCPQQYRNKPHEATAAILAGSEIGLSPMAALRAFDVIQGQAAPRAITIRAVVLSKGHKIRPIEWTDEVCILEGQRKGETDWQRVEWNRARAEQLGLWTKSEWKKQPKTMLRARADSEIGRLIAADAILGIPYSAEELEDGAYRITDARPERVRISQDVTADGPPSLAIEVDEAPIDPEQIKALSAIYKALGVNVTADKLAVAVAIVGRELASATDLTASEAASLIATLVEIEAGADPQMQVDVLLGKVKVEDPPAGVDGDYDPTTEPSWGDGNV